MGVGTKIQPVPSPPNPCGYGYPQLGVPSAFFAPPRFSVFLMHGYGLVRTALRKPKLTMKSKKLVARVVAWVEPASCRISFGPAAGNVSRCWRELPAFCLRVKNSQKYSVAPQAVAKNALAANNPVFRKPVILVLFYGLPPTNQSPGGPQGSARATSARPRAPRERSLALKIHRHPHPLPRPDGLAAVASRRDAI